MQVMACMAHVVAVLDDGGVYGWGKGRKGQLGDVGADSWTPRRVSGLQVKVERAVCGKDFTCLFGNARDGEVQMLGPDGRDRFNLKSSTPLKVPGWKGVCASWGNVFVLQDNGRLLAWGRDDHGQLGRHCTTLVTLRRCAADHGWLTLSRGAAAVSRSRPTPRSKINTGAARTSAVTTSGPR